MINNEFWEGKIKAFLHDPPDKIIRIRDHIERRMELLGNLKFYADDPLPPNVTNIKKELKKYYWKYPEKRKLYSKFGNLPSLPEIHKADLMASSLQRIDLEKIDGKTLSSTFYKIHSKNYILVGDPLLRHPITGSVKEYNLISSILPNLSEESEKEYEGKFNKILELFLDAEKHAFNELVKLDDAKKSYFALWRYYSELLKKKVAEKFMKYCGYADICKQLAEEFVNLTAYTLSPDHTLFDHADATSAIFGALSRNGKPDEKRKLALLMFKLSPVQDFIKNARKERDLWAGSHLLSFLTFQAIKIIVGEYGPDAVIFPHLRGQPFFDKEYEDLLKDVSDEVKTEDLKNKLRIANIPNKFLAIVGFGEEEETKKINNLKKELENIIKNIIRKIFNYAWDKTINSDTLEQVRNELIELKEKTKSKDKEKYEKALNELDRLSKNEYQRLVEVYFHITLEVLSVPFNMNELETDKTKSYEILENFVKSLNLPKDVEKKYLDWLSMLKSFGTHPARIFDLYSLMFEILEEIVGIESRKFEKVEGESAYKCSLCGELEAIGGRDYVLMRVLWSKIRGLNPILFRKNEYLCPICLMKRIYHEWLKDRKKWIINAGFESVSDVALKKSDWLSKAEKSIHYELIIEHLKRDDNFNRLVKDDKLANCELLYVENWNTRYLEENFNLNVLEAKLEKPRKLIESIYNEHGTPEKYYAILMMDGDNMGKMLMGDEMKNVESYLHPALSNYLPQNVKTIIKKTRRLITPATHSAISKALAHFSINIVPKTTVDKHRGELIYAGGDDVLALLPTDSALACAYEIQRWFGREWDGWNILPAKTMSAGILIVHYKHPLYDALDKVRGLEKKAKDLGRDAVTLGYLARSGSYDEVTFNWCIVPRLGEFIRLIKNSREGLKPSLSKRIIYHVVQEVENLPNDEGSIKAFLKYEFLRHYNGDDVERVAGVLTNETIDLAKNIRVRLDREDFEEQEDIDLAKVNSRINELIKDRELSAGRLYDRLRDVLGVEECEFYDELYCVILKRQMRDLFILLKILLNCDFGGVCCEGSD